MNIKPLQVNEAEKKINLFILLFNTGLLYFVYKDWFFLNGTIRGCGLFIQHTGLQTSAFLNSLIAVILLGLVCFRTRFRSLIFLAQLLLFFVIYKDFVRCQAGPVMLEASNHAIIFWILLSLTIVDLIDKAKIIFLIKFILIMSYFNSVFAKLLYDVHWANGYTLQFYFLERHLMLDLPLALPLITNHTLAVICSVPVLLAEMFSPLSLFNRRFEIFFLIFFLTFQIACIFIIELQFMKYYGLAYLIYLADYTVEYGPKLSKINSKN